MGMQRGLSQLIAGGLAGYMAGTKIKDDREDREAKREEREAKKEDRNREKLAREAAGNTLGAVGTKKGAAASGEEALTAGMGAMETAMANAADDQERAGIQKSYEPTISALQAQRGMPAMEGETYTRDQAQKDYVQALQGIDPGKAAQAELQGYQLDKFRTDAEKDKVIKGARDATAKWLKGRIKTGEDGAATDFNNEDFALGSKVYAMHLAEGGQYEEAFKAANEGMGYAVKKIQAETAERADAVTKAVALARNGSYDAAMEVSKRFLPDGSTPKKVSEGKDGRITVERESTLDGAALKPVIYKNRDELISSLNSIADPKEAAAYVERTFKHDIETRRLGMEGARVSIAKDAELRAKGKDDKADKEEKAKADSAVALYKQKNPGATSADLEAVRTGVMSAIPKEAKNEYSFTQNPLGMGGTRLNKDTGHVEVINEKGQVVSSSPVGGGQVHSPKNDAEFKALPSGAVYIDPQDGKKYRKP